MRRIALAGWTLAALAVAGCQPSGSDALTSDPVEGVDRIEMHDSAFEPPVVQVPAGTTVTWAFTDGRTQHNVVGDAFESEVMAEGTFTHTFDEPGTYDYACTLHNGMDGRVIVTEG